MLPTSLMVFFQLMPMVVKKILTSSSSFSPSKQAGREAESLWWRKRFDQIGAAEQAVRAFGDQIGPARHPEICRAPKRNLVASIVIAVSMKNFFAFLRKLEGIDWLIVRDWEASNKYFLCHLKNIWIGRLFYWRILVSKILPLDFSHWILFAINIWFSFRMKIFRYICVS